MIVFNAASVSVNRMDGLNRYCIELLKRIDKSKVIVIANKKVIENFNIDRCIEVEEELSLTATKANIKRLIWYQVKLPFYLKKYKVKSFYSPIPEGMFFPFTKQIITIHDILPILYPGTYPRLKYYFRFLLPLLINVSESIATISQSSKKDIRRVYNTKKNIFIIYPGYSKEKFYPREKEEILKVKDKFNLKKYIIYVGETRPYKNVERLIKAFSLIQEIDIILVIVGNLNRINKNIINLPKELGIENKVRFLGFVPDSDLPALYSGAEAFVFPSLYEGFGLPPLEAMACGTPVVVSNVASLAEVCGDAAYYVNPSDIKDIAKGIETVLKNETLRKNLIQKGLERVKLFTWERSAGKLMEIIRKAAL